MTDKKKCQHCGGVDLTAGGKCRACKKTGKVNGRPATAVLEIQQGYGLKAYVDEPYLMIEQSETPGGKPDAICLSRSELKQIVEKFGPWSAA